MLLGNKAFIFFKEEQHAHSLSFSKEHAPRRNPAAFLGFTSVVFSHAIRVLRWEVIVNLHVMRPTAHWLLIFFLGKCASQEGFLGVVTAIASVHSYPSQQESQILTKEHCTGDVRLFDSQFLTNRGSLLCESETSKRMSHQKVGMSKVAYHRLLVGGLDVVKRGKRWNTIGPSQKRHRFKGAKEMMKLSFACAQRSVVAWKRKALSFVLRAAGKVNITSRQPTTCVRT